MALVNKAINEVTVKLVYYGPGLCGKTTNLEKIYGNPKLENKGKMISMATETDRTLFFDFMPMELGTVAGGVSRGSSCVIGRALRAAAPRAMDGGLRAPADRAARARRRSAHRSPQSA